MTPPEARIPRFDGHRYPQIIPDPGEILPGGPAPWADVASRGDLTLEVVLSRLDRAGRQLGASNPPSWPRELVADDVPAPVTQRSAVLVGLFEEDGDTHVILTRRSFSMRTHRGEVSFPGGRSHDGETPTQTALREAHEEIGLDTARATPVSWLSPIATFASGSAIFPIVAALESRPVFVIDPIEVDRAFSVALSDLAAEGAFLEERWRRPPSRPGADAQAYFPLHFFRVPDDLVWGATARILTELLCLALGVPVPAPDDSAAQTR
jgi:8-oxo-dGTP pyrophosphatase MutT (NUDIX family)